MRISRLLGVFAVVFSLIPSVQAGATGDFDETILVSFDNVELEREFKVHVPASYDGTPMPLLFMFHNVGDTASNAIAQTDWNTTADANGFIVIYPQALNLGDSVNWDISAAPIDAPTKDTQFVSDMVDWARANYSIRQTRIFTTGLGMGGTFAYLAATQHSQITVFGCQSANASSGDGWFWPSSGKPELSAYIMCAPDQADLYSQSQLLRDHINGINGPGRWAHLQESGEGYGWKSWLNQAQWDYFMTVAVDHPPTAVASASANGTLTLQFSGSNSRDDDGYIAGYLWDFGDGATSIEADPSHTFAASGVTNATLTVTDSKGQTNRTTINVAPGLSNTPPQITTPASADATQLTLMADTTVHVAARDSDGDTLQYAWSQRDGGPGIVTFVTGDAADSIVEFSEAGTYDLRVTISDDNGGVATSDVRITVAAPASQSYTTYLHVDGNLRRFIVYVPPSYDGSTDYPLLFMFHGMGGTAEVSASTDAHDWQSTADANNFIVIFPESLTWPEYWYWNPAWHKHWLVEVGPENNTDVNFFDEMVEWSQANYAIKSTHIFTTGGSFGGFFSNYIAVARPDTVAAFAYSASGMSTEGWPNSDPDPAAPLIWPIEMPTSPPQLKGILLHDEEDPVIPYSQSTEMQAEMLAKGHISELITLYEMGHGWDKNQNQSQWDFFMNAASDTQGAGAGAGEGEGEDEGTPVGTQAEATGCACGLGSDPSGAWSWLILLLACFLASGRRRKGAGGEGDSDGDGRLRHGLWAR